VQKEAVSVQELIAQAHLVDHPHLLGEVLPRFDLGVDGIGDLLERRAAEDADAPFLAFYDDDARTRSDWTRGEWAEEVRWAVEALKGLGLRPGDRIATADEFNHSDTLLTLYAASRTKRHLTPACRRMYPSRSSSSLRLRGATVTPCAHAA